MWHDLILLARLEARRLKSQTSNWLRLLGFDRHDSCLFQAYVAGFWLFWVVAMGAFLVEQVELASRQVTVQEVAAVLDGLPPTILGLQLFYLLGLFLNPPLKLVAPDLLYVATSPVSRGAITAVHCARALLVPALLLAALGSLAALFFAWGLAAPSPGLIACQALLLTAGLAYLSGALSWAVALARQNSRSVAVWRAFGLVFLAAGIGAWLAPGVFLWPGRMWTGMVRGSLHAGHIALLLAGLAAALAALYVTGSRTHMAGVIDLSQTYARIRKLGVWGQVEAAEVVARLRSQSRIASRRRLRGRLLQTFNIPGTLFGQSWLVLVRLSPALLLRLLAAGAVFSSAAITLVTLGDASSVQTWALLFIALIQFRPNDALRGFQISVRQPFLRQFLPADNLLLFASQTSLPLLIMSAGVALAALLQPWVEPAIALLLAVAVLLGLALCQALENVRLPEHLLPGFSYEYTVIFLGSVIVGCGYLLHSAWAALAAMILADLGLALLLRRSTSV